jgi:hypothetical protein
VTHWNHLQQKSDKECLCRRSEKAQRVFEGLKPMRAALRLIISSAQPMLRHRLWVLEDGEVPRRALTLNALTL